MTVETPEKSVRAGGNARVTIVDKGLNALSAAVLEAGVHITYSNTADGVSWTTDQEDIEDGRFTLPVKLAQPGVITDTLELTYVYGVDNTAKTALAEGTEAQIAIRYVTPNGTPYAAAQLVDTVPFIAGVQRKNPPTSDGVLTITQKLYPTDVVKRDAAVVA